MADGIAQRPVNQSDIRAGQGAGGRYEAAMAGRDSKAGGGFLAAAILLGVLGGVLLGEPSLGFLVGLGAGLVALGAVWLAERRR